MTHTYIVCITYKHITQSILLHPIQAQIAARSASSTPVRSLSESSTEGKKVSYSMVKRGFLFLLSTFGCYVFSISQTMLMLISLSSSVLWCSTFSSCLLWLSQIKHISGFSHQIESEGRCDRAALLLLRLAHLHLLLLRPWQHLCC